MSKFNLKGNIILTVMVKVAILLLNFIIVVFTTRLWGAEGRGIIALFTADLGLIAIFSNIFTSSSVSYFLSKVGVSKLASQAYLWVAAASGIVAVVLSLIGNFSLTLPLFIVSVLLGFITFHSSLFIGSQKIPYYNLITFLQPFFLLLFMLAFYFMNNDLGYYSYFYGQIVSLCITFIISKIITRKVLGKAKFDLNKESFKQSFNFGWKVELSNLLQFLNYRLSFYLLEYFSDVSSVGIFSVGVTISEAIWVFSKSISLVQYSNVIKQGNTPNSRKETVTVSKYSFYASLVCLIIIFIIPKSIFGLIFGDEFVDVKQIILILSPGILAIAVSNVFGNYFSAIGKLKILILKSTIGLVATILLSIILIPKLHIEGACIVNSASYIISSLILFWYYVKLNLKTVKKS